MSHTSQSWLGSTSRSSTPRVIVPGATGRRTTALAAVARTRSRSLWCGGPPFGYGEFLANYFADACLARQPEESAFRRRGAAALASIPRQRFTALADSDRLLTEKDASGLYLTKRAV